MSSQRGNVKKSGPPKHKNSTAFRNDRHDSSDKQKMINCLELKGLCTACKQVIEWKIRYKKYKPLTKAKTCVSCSQKTVKKAYNIMCNDCAEQKKVCVKCVKKIEDTPELEDDEKEEVCPTSLESFFDET